MILNKISHDCTYIESSIYFFFLWLIFLNYYLFIADYCDFHVNSCLILQRLTKENIRTVFNQLQNSTRAVVFR